MSDACARLPGAQSPAAGALRRWRDADGEHIDVRGLEPPQPLVAIMRLVQELGFGPIVVHHDRDPKLLHPELAERGWTAERIDGEPGELRFRLMPDSR